MISNSLSKKKHSLLTVIAIAAALIGFGDSLYLTVTHYTGGPVVCSIVDGCNIVLASPWASVFGIPMAVLGLGYYGLILLMMFWYRYSNSITVWSAVLAVSTVGLIISFGLLYLQLAVIGAVCEYCLLSLISTACIWGGVLAISRFRNDTIEL